MLQWKLVYVETIYIIVVQKFNISHYCEKSMKKNFPLLKKYIWFIGVFGLQASLVIFYYGIACFYILKDARTGKIRRVSLGIQNQVKF